MIQEQLTGLNTQQKHIKKLANTAAFRRSRPQANSPSGWKRRQAALFVGYTSCFCSKSCATFADYLTFFIKIKLTKSRNKNTKRLTRYIFITEFIVTQNSDSEPKSVVANCDPDFYAL